MKSEILRHESHSADLAVTKDERDEYLQLLKVFTEEYLSNSANTPVYNYNQTDDYDWSISGKTDFSEILDIIQKELSLSGINQTSPGHLGYIPGGGLYASSISDYIAAVMNKFVGLKFACPAGVELEHSLIEWTKSILDYPQYSFGNLTSGGSIANLTAIVVARDYLLKDRKISDSVIYITQHTHHCIHKALKVAGLHNCHLRSIQVDKNYRMNSGALLEEVQNDLNKGLFPFLVVASCGSTDTGSIDPLEHISEICQQHNIWFHVDAAYGGYFMLCDDIKKKCKGIELSDSIVLDPHKSLFLPYGSGVVLVKNGKHLYDTFHQSAGYLQDANPSFDNVSPADLSIELTKHFRGLRMWLPLKLHGVSAFKHALHEKLGLCQFFYAEVQKLGFEVGPVPDLSVCVYRYVPQSTDANEFNRCLVKEINMDGRVFISSTTISNVFWLRIAILSFRTHLETIELYLSVLEEVLARVRGKYN